MTSYFGVERRKRTILQNSIHTCEIRLTLTKKHAFCYWLCQFGWFGKLSTCPSPIWGEVYPRAVPQGTFCLITQNAVLSLWNLQANECSWTTVIVSNLVTPREEVESHPRSLLYACRYTMTKYERIPLLGIPHSSSTSWSGEGSSARMLRVVTTVSISIRKKTNNK